jgi:hypothetical protein
MGAHPRRQLRGLGLFGVLACTCAPMLLALSLASLTLPGLATAATMTFGSPLAVPATKDTANDLGYAGSNIALPGSVFHIPHDGADTALWNAQQAAGSPTAPVGGQVTSVRLEGCARSNGPAPLTQIHFQALTPLPGGGARVALTSQAFDIPVCGSGGARGSTVTSYEPTDLCVSAGDYVDFNDEGGFVGAGAGLPPYPAGVPYMVIGAVSRSIMDSFVDNNGVGNGAAFSPGETSNHDGFAANIGEEVMLQATLATGPDASADCPGGTRGLRPPHPTFPALSIPTPQLDGMNAYGVVGVALYCHAAAGCPGTVTLRLRTHRDPAGIWLGAATFTLAAHHTGHVRVHLSALARRMVRRAGSGLHMQATVSASPTGAAAEHAAIAVHGATR